MFSAIMDVALGIVLLYLILSLIASALNEVISSRFQSRARTLEFFLSCLLYEGVEAPITTYRIVIQRIQARINKLLRRPAPAATDESQREMVSNFVNAPLLFAQLGSREFPSYIKDEDFAQAVFDFVRDQYKRTTMAAQQAAQQAATAATAAAAETAATNQVPPIVPAPGEAVGGGGGPIPAAAAAAQPNSITNQPIQALPYDDAFDFASLSAAVSALPPDMPLKRVLSSIILRVKEDAEPDKLKVDDVRTAIAQWYNNSMDRVSGWYKHDVQINLAIIGIILALLLNIDTISVANRLLQDPALRDAVSSRAQTIAQQVAVQPGLQAAILGTTPVVSGVIQYNPVLATPTALIATPTEPVLAGTPTTVVPGSVAGAIPPTLLPTQPPTALPADISSTDANITGLNTYIGSLVTLQGQINQLDVPIGWTAIDDYPTQTQPFVNFIVWWLKKIIGLTVTVLAIMQGAPFWFDLLNRVTNLRLTGTPPAAG